MIARLTLRDRLGALRRDALSRLAAAGSIDAGTLELVAHTGDALAMPKIVETWSMTSLREKLIKIGAKVVSHGRYVTFQLAEVAVPRRLFAEILLLIARLRAPPAPA
jgi:hypothetical protein